MMLAILMVLGAAAFRLAGNEFHWWNIAPLAAMALLGGMYFGRRYALWVPLVVLAISDLILNAWMGYQLFYAPRVIDYAAFAGIGVLGLWARSRTNIVRVGAAVATPFLFFLVSNFGVWLFGLNLANTYYPKTVAGLVECYTAGLPFLRGTLMGDWAFMGLFALAFVLAKQAAAPRLQWLVAEARA
jgi:hypothetical protein